MRILSVAFPHAAVRPDSVGGAEQIVAHLDRAIVEAGHESFVVACEGSCVRGRLVPTPRSPVGHIGEEEKRKARAIHKAIIDRTLDKWSFDVVHMHGLDFDSYLPEPGVPVIVTLHLPHDWYESGALFSNRPDTMYVFVSRSQQERAGHLHIPHSTVIENGVPVDELRIECPRQSFALSLGRICPIKNFHDAIEAARQAGMLYLLAGDVFPYPEHERYFEREISPRLDARRRFIGPALGPRKQWLLSSARCLLHPTRAPETSCLVAMEAAACGTPVIAYPSGAVKEIVEHGKTGFLVNNIGSMAEAVRALDAIDPGVCIETARRRFSLSRMTERYLGLYSRVGAGCNGRPYFA